MLLDFNIKLTEGHFQTMKGVHDFTWKKAVFMLLDSNYFGFREKMHSNRIRSVLLARMLSKTNASRELCRRQGS